MCNTSIYAPVDFISMPWKNGLGTTIELLKRELPGGHGGDFSWRLSMAEVTEDGTFSDFAGCDRTLVLLEGNGLTLMHDGSRQDILDKPLQAAQFSGSSVTTVVLHDGPVRDFNIMTRQGMCRAKTTCSIDSNVLELTTNADSVVVFAAGGRVLVDTDPDHTQVLSRHSLLLVEPATPNIVLSGPAFIAVEIFTEKEQTT